MTTGNQQKIDIVRRALVSNGVLREIDEVQYAQRIRAVFKHQRVTVLVFTTGTIVVQGRESTLKRWLERAKQSIEAGQPIPDFLPADDEDLESSSGSASLIDLPHLTTVDLVGSEEASEATSGVDAHEMAEVQDCPFDLNGVADDGGLS